MAHPFAQHDSHIRFDWGMAGARTVAGAALYVVIDVLSFTTTVSVAADAGIDVYPFPWRDERAEGFAKSMDAVLAQGRSRGGISLSPASVRSTDDLERLVLPSPNGSTITAALQDGGGIVLAASLRNAAAVGAYIRDRLSGDSASDVAVIAAGEHWPDGSLRPAVEDYWGAGAVIASIADHTDRNPSPEALTAANAYTSVASRIGDLLADCSSGRELVDAGFADDVAITAEVDRSNAVPVLRDGCYRDARK